jgi:hypothetical protein
VRIALKPVNGGMASIQETATKVAGRSFLDTLAQASSGAVSKPALMVAASNGSSSDTSDHDGEDQTSGQPIAAFENEAVDAQEIANAGSTVHDSALATAGEQNQNTKPGRAVLTIGGLAPSAHSQSQSRASQPAENRTADSNLQAGDQGAKQQIVVNMPAATLSEITFGCSMQYEAASSTASADMPAGLVVQRSNANSAEQTGSAGAGPSQSSVPPSASPAGPQSGVSIGRSMQFESASPAASADLPKVPAIQLPNVNSIAQTGSDLADTSQSQVPLSAPPVVMLSEVSFCRSMQFETASATAPADLPAVPTAQWLNANSAAQAEADAANASQSQVPSSASPATTGLVAASAAEFVDRSAFAIGGTFSPSMILSTGAGAGTLTDRASQFKSSGATFTANSGTVNSGDTISSKIPSTQGSIAADHSAQNGTSLPQHAPGDSSPATPPAIKPLEVSVTQTTPVSNHTALGTPNQPHAASSTSDVLPKAQDSADAAAEQLERTGFTAAAGINTARLIESMSESEMRVGMHSAEFGDISIRTSVSQQQLTAQINVDHSELGSAIAAHLPSLAGKLGGEFGLHASIEVNQLGGSVTGGNGQSSHQSHKMTPQSVPPDSSVLHADSDPITLPVESLENSRLDIRA